MEIKFIDGNEDLLDAVAVMWEKLNQHHRKHSEHFAEKYGSFTFADRKKGILEKLKTSELFVELAVDQKTNANIGYCFTTLTNEGTGEIESIFVEPEYRGQGTGKTLVKDAVKWLNSNNAKVITVGIAAGNEEVFPFYENLGFHPKVTILLKTVFLKE